MGRGRCTASTAALPPVADLDAARALHELVAELVGEREVTGVHDVSDGGLAVALCEMAFGGEIGFRVDLTPRHRVHRRPRRASASRRRGSCVSVAPDRVAAVLGRAVAAGVPAAVVGEAGGDRLVADGAFDVPLADAERAWRDATPATST